MTAKPTQQEAEAIIRARTGWTDPELVRDTAERMIAMSEGSDAEARDAVEGC